MSKLSTPQPSCASTDAIMKTDYVATVGEAASSFLLSPLFPAPAHARPFMYPLLFHFSNILYDTTSASCFFVSLVTSTGGKVSRMFSCVSSFVTDYSPRSLKFLRPVFSAYFFIMMWIMWFSLYALVIFIIVLSVLRCM